MIVMTMTSWPKRIQNCLTVIKTAFNQTVLPDRFYLNLAIEEFPNKENDLPIDLVEYVSNNDSIILNWVEKNTKTMKKVFPILQYLDDEDFIINLDDDTLLPNDLIETRLKDFQMHNAPITSCNNPKVHFIEASKNMWSCGPASIFKKKMLNHWEEFVNDEVLNSYNDDWTYSVIAWLNGYKFVSCSDYSRHTGISAHKLQKYNDNDGIGKNHGYATGIKIYSILQKRCKKMFGKNLIDSFNAYNGTNKQKQIKPKMNGVSPFCH